MKTNNPQIEKYRVRFGPLASDSSFGNNGAFIATCPKTGVSLTIIVSDGYSWDHVSVRPTSKARTPTWDEMCFAKNLFFEPEETVIQYHPPESEYVNNHPYVLHLWRPQNKTIPLPPSILVGVGRKKRKKHR